MLCFIIQFDTNTNVNTSCFCFVLNTDCSSNVAKCSDGFTLSLLVRFDYNPSPETTIQAISTSSNNNNNSTSNTFKSWSLTRKGDQMKFEVFIKNNNNNNKNNNNADQSPIVLSVTRKFKLKLWYHLTFTLSPIDAESPDLRMYINGQFTDKGIVGSSPRKNFNSDKPLKFSLSSVIYLGSPLYDKDGSLLTTGNGGSAIATSYDNIAMWHWDLNADEVRKNYETILGKSIVICVNSV